MLKTVTYAASKGDCGYKYFEEFDFFKKGKEPFSQVKNTSMFVSEKLHLTIES